MHIRGGRDMRKNQGDGYKNNNNNFTNFFIL